MAKHAHNTGSPDPRTINSKRRSRGRGLTAFAFMTVLVSPVVADILLPARNPDRIPQSSTTNIIAAQNIIAAHIPPVPTKRPKGLAKQAKDILVVETTSPVEREHNQKFDAYVASLVDLEVDAQDLENLRAGVKAIKKGQVETAENLKAKISDVAARKLIDWHRLRGGYGTPTQYQAFLNNNPDWPNRWLIQQRLEEALFVENNSAATIKSHFQNREPETGVGYGALASAYLSEGQNDKAREIAAKAWREFDIPARLEKKFLERFDSLLTHADHKYKIDRLMLNAPRWRSQKKKKAKVIRRLIPLLPKAERKKANARLNVFLGRKTSKSSVAKSKSENETDWGRVFHEIQVMRKKRQLTSAAKLIAKAPLEDQDKIVNPDAWWKERRRHAYAALDQGKIKRAYALVKVAGPLSDNPRKQQAFTAGWIALRYLKDAELGLKHMLVMKAAADGPLSRAKSAYWVGRAYEQMGKTEKAKAEYREAANGIDTFHGQLAYLKLNPEKRSIDIAPPAEPTEEQHKRFLQNDAVRAAVIAHKAGLGRIVTRPFFAHLRSVMKSEAEVALITHLTRAFGDVQMSLRMAKRAIGDGHNMIYYSYPLEAFPPYRPLRKPPETAFLLSIARQESEFEPNTKSGAGARGILQVMPITARHVCQDYKIKCNISRLMTDVSYNTKIASAYIADRMGEFGGSYVLGLAGYNAGPGRTRQWIRKFGDPRKQHMDPIDWIERIPFQETRRYVTKVLSNIQIYRARLGETDPRQLDLDLVRARAGGKTAAKP